MSPNGTDAPPDRSPRPRLALALLATAQFIITVDYSIVYVALPSIGEAFNFSVQSLQWVVSAYALALGGLLLLGGRAADLLGRRRLYITSAALIAVASPLAGLTDSQAVLIAIRGVQGVAAAALAPATLSLIATTFAEGRERNRALGVWGSAGAAGLAVGALAGGVLTSTLGWEWVFYVNLPVAGLCALLAPLALVESRERAVVPSFDVPGAVTATAGLTLLVFGLVRAPDVGWGSNETVLSLVGAAGLLAAFVVIEARSEAPLMPLRLFRSPTLSGANVAMILFQASTGTQFYLLTLYLQSVLGYSAIQTGLAFFPLTALIIVGTNLGGRLSTQWGPRATLSAGLAVAAAGLLIYARIPVEGDFVRDLLPAMAVVGIGQGAAFTTLFVAGTSRVRPDEQGVASGLMNVSYQVGGALGLACLVALVTGQQRAFAGGEAAALTSGLQAAFVATAVIAAAGALVALVALERRSHTKAHVEDALSGEGFEDGTSVAEPLPEGEERP